MLTFTTFYCANFTVLNYRVIFRIYVFQKNRKASNNMQEIEKKEYIKNYNAILLSKYDSAEKRY